MRLGASLSGQLITVASPLILIALGAYGVVGGGISSPGFWILVLGLGLLAAAAWTLPWEATIDADGVQVRTLLRRQHLAWDDIIAIERHRRMRGGGPLVARTAGRRRIAITDRVERPAEWDELKELVERYAPGVAMATPPPAHPFNR